MKNNMKSVSAVHSLLGKIRAISIIANTATGSHIALLQIDNSVVSKKFLNTKESMMRVLYVCIAVGEKALRS